MHVAARQCLLLQELQLQLDSNQKSKAAARAELQTQLNNHKAVCDELSRVQAERDSALKTAVEMEEVNAKVQAEKDSALQDAARLEEMHNNVTQVVVYSFMISCVLNHTKCQRPL